MDKLSRIVLPVVALMVIAGFTAFAAPAGADPFATFLFTGTITAVGGPCTAPAPFAGVVVGDTWSLTYTFDAATTDVDGSATAGLYRNAVTDMQLSIGGTSVSGSPGTALPSGFSSVIAVNLIISGFADYSAQVGLPDASASGQVVLVNDTGTPFGDDSLPLDLPTPLADEFPTLRAFFLRAAGSTLVCLQGTVNSFHVEPAEAIVELTETVTNFNLPTGIENSLIRKLDAALRFLEDANANNDVVACKALQAFINAVTDQRGNMIPEAEADALITDAQGIVALLSC